MEALGLRESPLTQFEAASNALDKVLNESPRLRAKSAAPLELLLHRPPTQSITRPVIARAPKRPPQSAVRRIGRRAVSFILFVAVIGGGYFMFTQLISGPSDSAAPPVQPQPITIRDTDGNPIVGAVSYPIPEFIGFTTTFVSTEVSIDNTIDGRRLLGTMGSGPASAWYAQFQLGPSMLAGRDLMNAGSGQPFCSRPTGTVDFICDPAVQLPVFLEPYLSMSTVSPLVTFVPANARPFAVATFAGEEALNGVTRSRYDIQIDGIQFEKLDPNAYAEWASALLIDVSGTVRLQLWIDENQMVWKSDVRTDGQSDHRTVTVTRADQLPMLIPFAND
ncbi:MAG: hypothetical protein ABL953_09820 [Ilumatobacteraceae bacterium]